VDLSATNDQCGTPLSAGLSAEGFDSAKGAGFVSAGAAG